MKGLLAFLAVLAAVVLGALALVRWLRAGGLGPAVPVGFGGRVSSTTAAPSSGGAYPVTPVTGTDPLSRLLAQRPPWKGGTATIPTPDRPAPGTTWGSSVPKSTGALLYAGGSLTRLPGGPVLT